MTYVIVGSCINDSVCTNVCPVDCIQPSQNSEDFKTAEMLYIDPDVCIDCNACAEACPIDAIYPANKLPEKWASYRKINADFFAHGRLHD